MTERKLNVRLWPAILAIGCIKFLVLFVALRLVGVINWPWVWVLAPVWIPTATVLILLCLSSILQRILRDEEEEDE